MKYLTLLLLALTSCAATNVDVGYANRKFVDWEDIGNQDGAAIMIDTQIKENTSIELAVIVTNASSESVFINRDTDDSRGEAAGFSLGIRRTLPITESLSLFTGMGMEYNRGRIDVDLSYSGQEIEREFDIFSPYAQVGARCQVDGQVSAFVVYRRTFFGSEENVLAHSPSGNSNTIIFGLGWGF